MGTSAVESSARGIEDEIGQFFGEFGNDTAETPANGSTDDAGAPPADSGSPAADPASTAPGESADAAPPVSGDAAADAPPVDGAAPITEPDPLESATPLAYSVNGETRTYDGIRVLGEHGAVIQKDALPGVIQRLSERDHYFEKDQQNHLRYRALEQASAWTIPSENGQPERTLTGPEAAVEMRVHMGALLAENRALVGALTDPAVLRSMLAMDDKNQVVVSPQALQNLVTSIENAELKSAQAIRAHYATVIQQAQTPEPPPTDFTAEAPRLIGEVAKAYNLDASVLTDRDKALIAEQLPVHAANGQVSVAWQNMVRTLIEDRAERKASERKLADTSADANKRNAAALAAAARGGVPKPGAPAKKPVAPPTPQSSRVSDAEQAWALRERLASGKLSQ